MKSNSNTLIVLAFASIILSLYVEGCTKKAIFLKGEPIRYQIIEIPEYRKGDYESLLDSKNDEVRYNAICNLIRYANEYGKLLSKNPANESEQGKSTKKANELKSAKHVYEKIASQLNGSNEGIKAVALIFLAEFGSSYDGKSETFNLVLNTKTNDIHTQYEQLNTLAALLEPESKIEPALITKYLSSRSWMVKSKTLLLLSRIKSDKFHGPLIKEYRKATNDFDKILIINVFRKGFGSDVFNLLKQELQYSHNPRLKYACARIIKNDRDENVVSQWITADPTSIPDEILGALIESYYGELANSKGQIFFRNLLSSNQEQLIKAVNQKPFFESLYDALKYQGNTVELSEIEAAVSGSPSLRSSWHAYKRERDKEDREKKEKAKREASFEKDILPKYNKMLEEFMMETEKLFIEGGMNQHEVEETVKDLKEFLRILKKEQNH